MQIQTFSRANVPSLYYVYSYLREDGTPYYVGKGKGYRAWSHSKRERIRTQPDKNRIKIIAHRLSEFEAHQLEISLIKLYGRKNIGTGSLHNGTSGGEGTSGHVVSNKRKEEVRIRMSGENNHMKLEKYRKMQSDKMKGTNHPIARCPAVAEKHRLRMNGNNNPSKNNSLFSIKQSEMMRTKNPMHNPISAEKRAVSITGDNHYTKKPGYVPKKLECPHCKKLVSATNYIRWHNDQCKVRII